MQCRASDVSCTDCGLHCCSIILKSDYPEVWYLHADYPEVWYLHAAAGGWIHAAHVKSG